MAAGSARNVWRELEELFRLGVSGPLDDAELLGRFVAGGRDESAESAFAAMVERHGPMVLAVCRRVLGDRHEAEDAFQATFLVLARKARWIARPEQLSSWLHGVAARTARDARDRDDRRRARERRASIAADGTFAPDDAPERAELRAILDEELARLPAAFRGPLILCELDGLSRQSAASRLGIPEGTLSSRLARARGMLRDRLTRRGLSPTAAVIGAVARPSRTFLIPPVLAETTIRAAARVAAGASLTGAASAPVVLLTQGALNAMFLAKVKGVAFAIASAAVVTTGAGVLAQDPTPRPGPGPAQAPAAREDRLDAVEKKLDRIIEALGNTRRGGGDAPHSFYPAHRPAAEPPPAAPRPPDAPPAPPRPPEPPMIVEHEPGFVERRIVTDDGRERIEMVRVNPPPTQARVARFYKVPVHPAEVRVAEMERRLADLERRFGEMERRLSRMDKVREERDELKRQDEARARSRRQSTRPSREAPTTRDSRPPARDTDAAPIDPN